MRIVPTVIRQELLGPLVMTKITTIQEKIRELEREMDEMEETYIDPEERLDATINTDVYLDSLRTILDNDIPTVLEQNEIEQGSSVIGIRHVSNEVEDINDGTGIIRIKEGWIVKMYRTGMEAAMELTIQDLVYIC